MSSRPSGQRGDPTRARVSGAVLAQLQRSAELDLLGPMPLEDQIEHALGFVQATEEELGRPPGSVVDLGTGGGLPGLVLVGCWVDASVVLLDANQRRTDFLTEEMARSGESDRVSVVRARAEEAGRTAELREGAEVVVARSFGTPGTTAECASPLVTVGGRAIVSEPPAGEDPGRWPDDGLARVGLERAGHHRYLGRFGYQALRKVEPCDDRYPRRVGIPAKRPLF